MYRYPTFLLLLLTASVSAQEPRAGGPGKPLAPEEARKAFHLPPGLTIELVACEPQIESPVAMQFDPSGRLWVVEMRDYPNGPPPGKPGAGRIRILEDRDGDGFYERSTIFADNLLFANGLLLWKDGVIVTAAPDISWIRDTDSDGKADKTEVLYKGFAALNPQLRVSHPILGLDGYVYVANGLRGGAVTSTAKDAKPVNLGGMDFRFDPITGKHEAISGMGQFGNTFDDWGNRFVCDNRHHLRHIVLENRYLARNPFLAAPSVVEDISILDDGPLSSGGKIYPLSKNWTTSNLHEGRFTAACGVFIYRGSLLKDYQGVAFTCDPTGNLVHAERMEPKGGTFESRPLFKAKEFLATADDWCRPVFLSHGPDDALYMVDMYRAVIEHPEFMPPELKNRPDLTLGKEKGRIWRIVPEAKRTTRKIHAKASSADLVTRLDSPSAWERDSAFRLLHERQDKDAVPSLKSLLSKTKIVRAKVDAGWLLEAFGPMDQPLLMSLLRDRDPRVQEQALLLAESRPASPEILATVRALAKSDDAKVRFRAALTLGNWKENRSPEALTGILVRGADDRWTRLAVGTSLTTHVGEFMEVLLKEERFHKLDLKQRQMLIAELTTLIGAKQDSEDLSRCFQAIHSLKGPEADALARTAFLGIAAGSEKRGKSFRKLLETVFPNPEGPRTWASDVLGKSLKLAGSEKAPLEERIQAIQLAGHGDWREAVESLLPLLDATHPTEIRLASLRALGKSRDKLIARELLGRWKSFTPGMQREAVDILLRSPDTTVALLEGVEKKQVRPTEIEPARMRQLLKHPATDIQNRAAKLLTASLPADRKDVLEKYQASLTRKGEAKRGQAVFAKHCMTCHKVAGQGTDVGPDISDTRTKTTSTLLADILNPNQGIDANYIQYLVTTKSGRSLTGILAAETASSITLKRAEGQVDIVLRSDIDTIESTGLSLMPDGLERAISVEEMADLLAFLKNWRYLDGSVPLRD